MIARICFQKNAPVRFSSVLDMQKIWERAARRANLKLEMSSGYNPKAKIHINNPLPTGFTGRNEIVEIWFQDSLTSEELIKRLNSTLPDGIIINSMEINPKNENSKRKSYNESQYLVTVKNQTFERIEKGIKEILDSERLERKRNNKIYDLRPLIFDLKLNKQPNDEVEILMILSAGPNKTGRPDEVIHQLGINLSDCHFDRISFN